MTGTMAQIRACVLPIQTWRKPAEADGTFRYVDIGSVDRDMKVIVAASELPVAGAPSRARQLLRAHDVLVSTVRPNLNAVAMVPQDLDGCVGSTGFTVLRANPNRLLPQYLFHWVRTPLFVAEMVRRATGASYPAISDRIVLDSSLPVPAIDEQRRTVDLLDRADAIRCKRKTARGLAEELLQSAFIELVGPASPEYRDWPMCKIESLAAQSPNAMRTGPFGSALLHSEFVDEGVAVLGIDNAVRNHFAWGERRFITREKFEGLRRYTVHGGDVIITIMGTTGRSAVIPDDIPLAITTKHLATISLDRSRAEPEFVSQALFRHPEILCQIASANRGAIMSGLNLKLIKALTLPVPPLERQREFTAVSVKVRGMVARMERDNLEERLFESLLERAFSGQRSASEAQC